MLHDIYITPTPPSEASCEGTLRKLKNKNVYGLAEASLYRYNRVREIVLQGGGKISKVDPAGQIKIVRPLAYLPVM